MIVYITMYCEILQVFKIKSKYLRLHSQKKSRNFFPEKFLLFFISDQFLSTLLQLVMN